MQNQNAHTTNETIALAKVSRVEDLDAIANVAHARNWVRMCERSHTLRERFEDLYLAAQLTLLGTGITPELQ